MVHYVRSERHRYDRSPDDGFEARCHRCRVIAVVKSGLFLFECLLVVSWTAIELCKVHSSGNLKLLFSWRLNAACILACAEESKRRLQKAGYQHLSEKAEWSLENGGKYFFTRNFSTIVAFTVGKK